MRVLFFAQLKDATGCDSIELAPPSSLNTEQLWAELLKSFPRSPPIAPTCAFPGIGNTPRRTRCFPMMMKSP